jgi:hypothetical protein
MLEFELLRRSTAECRRLRRAPPPSGLPAAAPSHVGDASRPIHRGRRGLDRGIPLRSVHGGPMDPVHRTGPPRASALRHACISAVAAVGSAADGAHQPSLGHQSRRRTHATSAVRSGADSLDLAPTRVSMASASRHPGHSQSATWRSISPSTGCPCNFCKKAPVLLFFTTMPFHL